MALLPGFILYTLWANAACFEDAEYVNSDFVCLFFEDFRGVRVFSIFGFDQLRRVSRCSFSSSLGEDIINTFYQSAA